MIDKYIRIWDACVNIMAPTSTILQEEILKRKNIVKCYLQKLVGIWSDNIECSDEF